MLLLMLLALDASSSGYLAKRLTHLFVNPVEMVAGVLQLIETIMHVWSVSALSQSALFKPKPFLTVWYVVLE